jgi:hypothetical protein
MSTPERTRWIPAVGESIVLTRDGLPVGEGWIVDNYGVARLLAIQLSDDSTGVIVLQPDGKWWWVCPPERREPWEGDAEQWRE